MRLATVAMIALLGLATVAVAQRIVSPPEVSPRPAPSQPPSPGAREFSSPQEPQPGDRQQPAATDQRGTDQIPLTVKVLPSPKSQTDINEENRRADEHAANERGLTNATWALGGITLFLVLVGGAQLALFFVQLRYIRESLDDAKIAATAAKDGAAAAEKGAKIAEAAMITAQRAYVSVRLIRLIAISSAEKITALDAMVTLENTGNTPTKNLIYHTSMKIFDGDISGDFDFPDLGPRQPRPAFIAPKTWVGTFNFPIDREELIASQAGHRRIFVWGWADYDDTFAGTPRHRTEFCHEIFALSGVPLVGHSEQWARASQYGRYNAADDECQRRPNPDSAA